MELGGDGVAIENTEEMRDELLKVAFGIWDHMKNQEDHGYQNWELEWVGFLPGKRESVRYIGEHVLTQNDIESEGHFEDVVAYGGWAMDDHNPLGMKANKTTDLPSIMYPAPSPYGIPYRCFYSVNVKNLFFAGRNISATHAAMSSTRVMGTCSLIGQAVGTAAAMCNELNILPGELKGDKISILQQKLLDDGVFIPFTLRKISDLTKSAKLNLDSEKREILFNGTERPRSETELNYIELNKGETIEFDFDKKEKIDTLRIQFDLDFSKRSVSVNEKMRVFPQKLHQGLDFKPVKVAATIVKNFEIYGDGEKIYETDNNYYSLVKIPVNGEYKNITVKFNETWGADKINIFACDFID